MKILRTLALLTIGAAGLAGCGDGGVQSPDFTPELRALGLTAPGATDDTSSGAPPNQYFIPLGLDSEDNTLVASALCTMPPKTDPDDADAVIEGEPLQNCGSSADFSITTVSGGGAAHVSNGRIIGDAIGVVAVRASRDGITSENELRFRIGAPVVVSLTISPEAPAPIAENEALVFTATATLSNGETTPVQANWTVTDENGGAPTPGLVTIDPGPSTTSTFTPQSGSRGMTFLAVGTYTATDDNGGTVTVTDSSTVTISSEVLMQLLRIEPDAPTVAVGSTVTFTAIGQYTGGATSPREGTIPASQVEWSSSDTASATIDTNTGVATGVAPGTDTDITGSLRPAVVTGPGANRSDSTTLTVLTAQCTSPLLAAQNATTSVETTGLCVLCGVTDPNNVIDASPDTFATMFSPVGLLAGTVVLNVDSAPAAADFPIGSRAGLIVAKPAGLLTAEILSSLTLSTRSNGAVVEAAGAEQSTPLSITLLGAIGGQDAALLSFPATQPFDGLAVTFNVGLVSLLPTVNVFQACGNSAPPPATP